MWGGWRAGARAEGAVPSLGFLMSLNVGISFLQSCPKRHAPLLPWKFPSLSCLQPRLEWLLVSGKTLEPHTAFLGTPCAHVSVTLLRTLALVPELVTLVTPGSIPMGQRWPDLHGPHHCQPPGDLAQQRSQEDLVTVPETHAFETGNRALACRTHGGLEPRPPVGLIPTQGHLPSPREMNHQERRAGGQGPRPPRTPLATGPRFTVMGRLCQPGHRRGILLKGSELKPAQGPPARGHRSQVSKSTQ